MNAVADHLRRLAPGRRDDAVADDQQSVVVARCELLDHHRLLFERRGVIGG